MSSLLISQVCRYIKVRDLMFWVSAYSKYIWTIVICLKSFVGRLFQAFNWGKVSELNIYNISLPSDRSGGLKEVMAYLGVVRRPHLESWRGQANLWVRALLKRWNFGPVIESIRAVMRLLFLLGWEVTLVNWIGFLQGTSPRLMSSLNWKGAWGLRCIQKSRPNKIAFWVGLLGRSLLSEFGCFQLLTWLELFWGSFESRPFVEWIWLRLFVGLMIWPASGLRSKL